jgi:hypothetical protein
MQASHDPTDDRLDGGSPKLSGNDTGIFISQVDEHPSSHFESVGRDNKSESSTTAGQTYCPLCGVEIDGTWLIGWRLDKRSSYQHKKRFCLVHTKRSAKIEWRERGYPNINWRSLKSRFRSFHSALNRVISEGVQDNKPKKPRLSIANQIPLATAGYYGPKGRELM